MQTIEKLFIAPKCVLYGSRADVLTHFQRPFERVHQQQLANALIPKRQVAGQSPDEALRR